MEAQAALLRNLRSAWVSFLMGALGFFIVGVFRFASSVFAFLALLFSTAPLRLDFRTGPAGSVERVERRPEGSPGVFGALFLQRNGQQ